MTYLELVATGLHCCDCIFWHPAIVDGKSFCEKKSWPFCSGEYVICNLFQDSLTLF